MTGFKRQIHVNQLVHPHSDLRNLVFIHITGSHFYVQTLVQGHSYFYVLISDNILGGCQQKHYQAVLIHEKSLF